MTIISPENRKAPSRLDYISWFFVGLVGLVAMICVRVYTQTVAMNHAIKTEEQHIQQVSDTAALYDKELYGLLDAQTLKVKALNEGLVEEKSPRYLVVPQERQMARGL